MGAPVQTRFPRAAVALALLIAAICAAAPAAASAAEPTLTVSTLSDAWSGTCSAGGACTLREALALASDGTTGGPHAVSGHVTVGFSVEGTIELGSELEVTTGPGVESVAIVGPGEQKLTIDPGGGSRAFKVAEGEVAISGLSVAHGNVTGTAIDGDGGAALYEAGGRVTLEGVRFTENAISDWRSGGAIDVEGGDLTIVGSTIDHNSCNGSEFSNGSGGGINLDSSSSTLTLRHTEVSDNQARTYGGGINQEEGTLVVSEGSVISGNHSEDAGGGILAHPGSSESTTITDSEIRENSTSEGGGGLVVESYAHSMAETTSGGPVLLERSTVAANTATLEGDGVVARGNVTIVSSTISGNHFAEGASIAAPAGILIGGVATLVLEHSTVADNSGAIASEGGTTKILASTIAGNSAPASLAGGIMARELPAGTIKVRSSIVAGNSGESGPADCEGAITSEGHNVVGTVGSPCAWETGEGDQLGVSPELGPLADNGGPTLTMAPTTRTSPAINHGSGPETEDQRGETRPVPAGEAFADVGAVEVQAPVAEEPPAITASGELVEGTELSCSAGSWNTDTVTDPTYEFGWTAGGEPVGEGTTYVLEAADVGKQVACRETADDGATSITATSTPVELPPGALSLEPASLDLGGRNTGLGPGKPQPLTLTNTGGTAVTVTGALSSDPTQFPVALGDCALEGGRLAPRAECQLEARFDPETAGPLAATVTVLSDGGAPTAALSGTGTAPAFSLLPSEFDFGTVATGSGPGAVHTFVLTDTGTGPATLGPAALEGASEFTIPAGGDGCREQTLQPNGSCSVEVAFTPAAGGERGATLRVSGAPSVAVKMRGTGAPASQPSVALELPGEPQAPLVANSGGGVRLHLSCDSAGAPCHVTIALHLRHGGGAHASAGAAATLGRWWGRLAAGATRSVAVPLNRYGRRLLGARHKLTAIATLAVSGGATSKTTLRLTLPPAPTLTVRGVSRRGGRLRVSLACRGAAGRCRGHVAISAGSPRAVLAAGAVTIPRGRHAVSLDLSRGHLADAGARVRAVAVARDAAYHRLTTRAGNFRIHGDGRGR